MSNRRNRRNQKARESDSISTEPAAKQTASQPPSLLIQPEVKAKVSRWTWIYDHHQVVASYAALGGVFLTIIGMCVQWSQQKDSDRQIEILRKSIEQTHSHEIAPRLVVDTMEENEFVRGAEGIAVKLRNVGRGIAKNAVARVHLLRFDGKPLEPECVIARQTIAPGDSTPFRFKFPAPPESVNSARGMIGTIGLYCQDDDGHEVLATQRFTLSFHQNEHGRYIFPHFTTPNVHRLSFAPRTSENVRTEDDVGGILDYLVTAEHDRLRKLGQTNPLPTSPE